jgi:hypothetical protein
LTGLQLDANMRQMDRPPEQQPPKTPQIEPTERYEEFVRDQAGRLLRKYERHKRRKLRRRSKPVGLTIDWQIFSSGRFFDLIVFVPAILATD